MSRPGLNGRQGVEIMDNEGWGFYQIFVQRTEEVTLLWLF